MAESTTISQRQKGDLTWEGGPGRCGGDMHVRLLRDVVCDVRAPTICLVTVLALFTTLAAQRKAKQRSNTIHDARLTFFCAPTGPATILSYHLELFDSIQRSEGLLL